NMRRAHQWVVGAEYSAIDPALMRWVLATLIDTALLMHRRFVGPVSTEDATSYYGEMCRLGEWVGIASEEMPADPEAFRAYVAEMVATLQVTPEARGIARDLFAPLPEAPWLSPA